MIWPRPSVLSNRRQKSIKKSALPFLNLSRSGVECVKEGDRFFAVVRRVCAEATSRHLSAHLRKVWLGCIEPEDTALDLRHLRWKAGVRRNIRLKDRNGSGRSGGQCWAGRGRYVGAPTRSGEENILADEVLRLLRLLLLISPLPLQAVAERLARSWRLAARVDRFGFGVFGRNRLFADAESGKVPSREEGHRVLLDRVQLCRVLLRDDQNFGGAGPKRKANIAITTGQ